jgi:hypothetical protein
VESRALGSGAGGDPAAGLGSNNQFDWLGSGIYFWENSRQRALDFGQEQHARGKIQRPTVLGAYLHLGRCFDLTDLWATDQLGPAYDSLVRYLTGSGAAVPENRACSAGDHDLLLRNLDCAVMNFYLREMDRQVQGGHYFQTVRGVFVEGEPAYPGAKIHRKTHIQIAVRDPTSILGYFRPVQHPAAPGA